MRILIWGTGQLAWHTINNVNKNDIIGFIDTYKKKDVFAEKKVYFPDEVKALEYDAILVSLSKGRQVYEKCREIGIDLKKVIFVYGNAGITDLNTDYAFIKSICGERLCKAIKNRYHLIREIDTDPEVNEEDFDVNSMHSDSMYQNDYIRVKTLELLSNLIYERYDGKVEAANAELGVFRGDFARFINAVFPDNKLYLFDTFEGFDEDELKKEKTGIMRSAGRDIFKETAEIIVLQKMLHLESIEIKKGLFPDSLMGLEEKFAFVSIDCDWEESIYQGIKYFYPRLIVGGYIMIHDYNNFLGCAKKAIKRYENECGKSLAAFPLCDNQGSLILTK